MKKEAKTDPEVAQLLSHLGNVYSRAEAVKYPAKMCMKMIGTENLKVFNTPITASDINTMGTKYLNVFNLEGRLN